MSISKFLKAVFLFLLAVILLVLVFLLKPINRQSIKEQAFYSTMMSRLDSLDQVTQSAEASALQAGWAKQNITPSFPVYLVGYKPRGPHTEVFDSLFARAIVLQNAQSKWAMVSVDLLMFPPAVVEYIESKLGKIDWDISQIYFSATHTHTSFGGWQPGIFGQFTTAKANNSLIQLLGDAIVDAIAEAERTIQPAQISFQSTEAKGLVAHRLDKASRELDESLRWIRLKKISGDEALWLSFSAHPSTISKHFLKLSRDYPGVLLDELEKGGFSFAMFSAGMVGSHRPIEYDLFDFEFARDYGKQLANLVLSDTLEPIFTDSPLIHYQSIPVVLPKSQLRLSKNLALRDWVFRTAISPLAAEIKFLQIGDILLFGMPCDFSGEIYKSYLLDQMAQNRQLSVMITSFNGQYIGYITHDRHYDISPKDEVRSLNWVGPGMGAYFAEILQRLIDGQARSE
jgi:neutral ceramidase